MVPYTKNTHSLPRIVVCGLWISYIIKSQSSKQDVDSISQATSYYTTDKYIAFYIESVQNRDIIDIVVFFPVKPVQSLLRDSIQTTPLQTVSLFDSHLNKSFFVIPNENLQKAITSIKFAKDILNEDPYIKIKENLHKTKLQIQYGLDTLMQQYFTKINPIMLLISEKLLLQKLLNNLESQPTKQLDIYSRTKFSGVYTKSFILSKFGITNTKEDLIYFHKVRNFQTNLNSNRLEVAEEVTLFTHLFNFFNNKLPFYNTLNPDLKFVNELFEKEKIEDHFKIEFDSFSQKLLNASRPKIKLTGICKISINQLKIFMEKIQKIFNPRIIKLKRNQRNVDTKELDEIKNVLEEKLNTLESRIDEGFGEENAVLIGDWVKQKARMLKNIQVTVYKIPENYEVLALLSSYSKADNELSTLKMIDELFEYNRNNQSRNYKLIKECEDVLVKTLKAMN